MKQFITTLSLVIVLMMSVSIAAAQSAENVEGGNALVQKVLSETPLPDGNMLLSTKSTGFTWTMDPEASLGNGSIKCYGSNVMSSEGEPLSGAGSCRVLDTEGDIWNIWWTGATGGDWGITNGTGKYDGVTGGGTWANDEKFADGKQTNKWTGSWTFPDQSDQ